MKPCRVYWRDRQNIEHGVYVEAENRYHAFGLAMHAMRKCAWCNPDYHDVQRMTVEVLNGRRQRLVVTRDEFESWLGPPALSGDKIREYLLMLLGRMAPDRDFKRHRSQR